jgi:peroxiredoxin
MKKLFLLLAVLTVIACTNQQSKIKGRITDSKGKLLYFEHVDVALTKTLDSVELNNSGRFRFSASVKIPEFYQLRLGKGQIINLLMKPGETITITGNGNDVANSLAVTGSFETENLNKLTRYLAETIVNLDSVNALYLKATEDTLRERLYNEYVKILEKHRKYSMAYILTYNKSLTCIYALYQQLSSGSYVFYKATDLQFFKIVSDTLSKYYPKSKHVLALRKNTTSLLNNYQTRRFLQMADTVYTSLPRIELEDMNGTIRKLSSLKGKYVLLSFWASWNPDCITQNLQFKEVYKKFKKNNFEILQVSFDNSSEAWKRAVRFDELPWVNVIDPTFPNSTVAVNYNVQNLPANFLIDKDNNTILAKDINPRQLHSRLLELLN